MTGFRHPDGIGFIADDEAFWLVEPGVAVEVRIAPGHAAQLRTTALGVRLGDPGPG